MVTMVDEIFDRHYQEGRNELNAALGSLARNRNSFTAGSDHVTGITEG